MATSPKQPKVSKTVKPRAKSATGVLPERAKTPEPHVLNERPKLSGPYIEAIGRRKRAIARVRASVGTKTAITVNGRTLEQYFGTPSLCAIVSSPLSREGFSGKYTVSVHVGGGGTHAQAEAIRLGLSRILVKEDATQKGALKKLGFLKRDSRKVERKHFGLKKARKRKQWKKR